MFDVLFKYNLIQIKAHKNPAMYCSKNKYFK